MTECGMKKVLFFLFACKNWRRERGTGFTRPHAKIMTEYRTNPGVSLPSSLI